MILNQILLFFFLIIPIIFIAIGILFIYSEREYICSEESDENNNYTTPDSNNYNNTPNTSDFN